MTLGSLPDSTYFTTKVMAVSFVAQYTAAAQGSVTTTHPAHLPCCNITNLDYRVTQAPSGLFVQPVPAAGAPQLAPSTHPRRTTAPYTPGPHLRVPHELAARGGGEGPRCARRHVLRQQPPRPFAHGGAGRDHPGQRAGQEVRLFGGAPGGGGGGERGSLAVGACQPSCGTSGDGPPHAFSTPNTVQQLMVMPVNHYSLKSASRLPGRAG